MFDENSRYSASQVVEVETAKGEKVTVVKLRRLPYTPGNPTEVKGTDRLDIMAHRKYANGTKFWHVADANTELEANKLVENEISENPFDKVSIRYIRVPEN